MIAQPSNASRWLDCNENGRPHLFVPDFTAQGRAWWICEHCPTSTVTVPSMSPDPWLGKDRP